jgi:predicted RND superfamily exporter protein
MDSLRADLAAVTGNEDGDIFAYGRDWLNYEQYKSIANEAVRNVTVTLAACLVIIAILVVEIKTVISVFLALCMIFVNIVGYMHFWGLSIDSVTVIMLVIALGLAVDYSAHIGRAYLEKLGTPDERVVRTLEDMGVAVWNGAMSTFMAVLILGSSDSYVFQTFFKQLFLCIVLGLTHGLIFLPSLLSLLNPKPYAEAH